MKKLLSCILVLFAFGIYTHIVLAAEVKGWLLQKSQGSNFLAYYVYNDECIVSPHNHGGEVALVAYDKNWRGRTLVQTSIIVTEEDGGTRKTESYSVSPASGDSFADAQEIEDHKYDIFETRCRTKDRDLPEDLKNVFYRYYDITR